MRNSHSDSQLDRRIKKEVNMGDYDENRSTDSGRRNPEAPDATDITAVPLTDEEYKTLEANLQGEGLLGASSRR